MERLFYCLISIFFYITLYSCVAQKENREFGLLKGMIGVFEGNCMPGPNVPPCKAKPISTTIYITKPSKSFSIENLVDSVRSSDEGIYSIKLPAGNYSLFLKDQGEVVCTGLQCPSDCYCMPFAISGDSTTVLDTNLDHATW